jgi:hypothetical protein
MSCIGGPTEIRVQHVTLEAPVSQQKGGGSCTLNLATQRFAISVRSGWPSSARLSDAQIAERRAQ